MKKCICIILVIVVSILSGCNSSQNEENVFPQNLKEVFLILNLQKIGIMTHIIWHVSLQ